MVERLNNMDVIRRAESRIRELLCAHEEWLYARTGLSRPSSLRRSEIDVRLEHGHLVLSCVSDEGVQVWRVNGWEWTEGKLCFEASRSLGRERALLEFIPRASASSINALVSATRRARCQSLAELARALSTASRIARVSLSAGARRGQPGRYARIMLEVKREAIAVTATVAEDEARAVDAFLSAALCWFARAGERARKLHLNQLWLVARRESIEPLAQRIALLRDELRRIIKLFEIDEEWQSLAPSRLLEREELWRVDERRLSLAPTKPQVSETAARINALAPEAIDVVRARHGETLRFHGMPFARVRKVMRRERVWFGLERTKRRLLDEDTCRDWEKLLAELQEHRRAEACDHRHALYRAAPEAWLESLLRRDITRLDPGLRLAPVHVQFRMTQANTAAGGARPVDLLALRRDGRLAVIELKVSEDREHVIQGADYWRRVEAHRRTGNITRARLFGDAEIADEPPLVYLVAPTLRFHRAFQTLAALIDPHIQIFRFDLNENWREGVRVMRRVELDDSSRRTDNLMV